METQEIVKKEGLVQRFRVFAKNNKKWIFILTGVLTVSGFIFFGSRGEKIEYVTEAVKPMDLKSTVSATGTVEAKQLIDLNFQVLGEVEKVNVEVGDLVKTGDELATLKNSTLTNKIKEAQANVVALNADLQRILDGAKSEEIRLSQKRVASAQTVLNNAKRDYSALNTKLNADIALLDQQISNLEQKLADTKVSAALSVTNSRSSLLISLSQGIIAADTSVDKVREILNDLDLKDSFGAADASSKNQVLLINDQVDNLVTIARADLNKAQSSNSGLDLSTSYNSTSELLNKVELMLDATLRSLFATPETFTNQTKLSTYKTTIKTESANNNAAQVDVEAKYQLWNSAVVSEPITINTVQFSLNEARSQRTTLVATKEVQLSASQANIDSAQSQLDIAKAELDLTISKASSAEIAAARARVLQAESVVAQLNSEMDKYRIVAPFDGTVSAVNVDANEVTKELTTSVVTLLGVAEYDITVNVPESDIVKIANDNPVAITLDAFGEDVIFSGSIKRIDPAETKISDVVYYKVELLLDPSDRPVKQGMTANVDIITFEKKDALTIPRRAVLERQDGTKYVRLKINGDVLEKTITTGLRGDEGRIEVLSGLEEGDQVVVFEKTVK